MIVEIPEYKNISQQQIDFGNENITTLIGGNGAGKSTILESIFQHYIEQENILREEEVETLDDNTRCIAFSSGQNELFSSIFNNYDRNARRYNREDTQTVRSFYFDYWWSRVLIFFAVSLRNNGNARKYLLENGYIEHNNDYCSIKFGFRVRKPLVDKIVREHETEEAGEYIDNPLFRSLYIRYLKKIIQNKIDESYDFADKDSIYKIVSRSISIEANEVNTIFGSNIEEIFTFFARASTTGLSNFDLEDIALYFNDLEFEQLSDGEYQLLSIYAIIDLFDNQNTIFLFDEIDSHLHYTNIEKLWQTLKGISSKIIATTHISESIIQNDFKSLTYVENGKIENDLTAQKVFQKISRVTGASDYEYKIASKIKYIALLDDDVDWLIFKKLAKKKMDTDEVEDILNQVVPYKRTSSYNDTNEVFGKSKLFYVKAFKEKQLPSSITKALFLICDRDKLPLTEIDNELSVNIHSDFRNIKSFNNNTKTYLKSWRMLEIENYLLSKTMLEYFGKFDQLKDELPQVNFDGLNSLDESEDIRTYDAKSILHPLYKDGGFDESKLDDVVDKILPEEISEDIVIMYNFIKSKVEV